MSKIIQRAKDLAKNKKGKYKKYFLKEEIVQFECANGHKFFKRRTKLNQWCPYHPCSTASTNWQDEVGYKIFKQRFIKEKIFQNYKIITAPPPKSKLPFKYNTLKGKLNYPANYKASISKKNGDFEFYCKKCKKTHFKKPGAVFALKTGKNKPLKFGCCVNQLPLSRKEIIERGGALDLELKSPGKNFRITQKLLWFCKRKHRLHESLYKLEKAKNETCEECGLDDIKKTIKKFLPGYKLAKGQKYKGRGFSDKYKLICPKQHEKRYTEKEIKKGKGCSICYKETLFNSLPKLNSFLKKYDSKFKLSSEFSTTKRMKFDCQICGEKSSKTLKQIQRKQFCTFCRGYKNEEIVRSYFEKLFKKRFRKTRDLKWLKKHPKAKNNLELDGYNDELKLGFEHQGIQHYKLVDKFKNTKKDVKNQKKIDQKKRKLCLENGVRLIEIVRLGTITKEEELIGQIRKQFLQKRKGLKPIELPKDFDKIAKNIDSEKIHKGLHGKRRKEIAKMAKELCKKEEIRFKYIKPDFPNLVVKCEDCSREHSRPLNRIKIQCGCKGKGIHPNDKKAMFDFYKKLAQKNKAKIISKKYIDQQTPLEFECQICLKNPKVLTAKFKKKPLSFKFEDKLEVSKFNGTFHTNCGTFNLRFATLKDLKNYIKRNKDPKGKIYKNEYDTKELTQKDFSNNRDQKYYFQCGNKNHIREPKKIAKLKNHWCSQCR